MLAPDPVFTCVDCGGQCHLLTQPREDGIWLPGDVLAYRCASCMERFDIVLDDDAYDDEDQPG